MGKAARAIIIEGDNFLVMHRKKYGDEYFTLVGGRIDEGETAEQALSREVKEETGLIVTDLRFVYYEQHPAPYNEQYIYLCSVAPHGPVKVQDNSEEAMLNSYDMNIHQPEWISTKHFANLPFRTPQLHEALMKAFKKGFPTEPVRL
ncbi:MAG TPA: NUDIX domain-containing protein [Candidatus Saccharimonadales bacterium]|nr:NUDIX domain-containing protein [Candidatus Saccharimonadales bacterium]